jgi:signal transduction histidine kinase
MPDGERLILSCENKIRTDREIPESNGIGLRTCAKMMEEMGGKLSFASIEGRFTVTLTFPLEKKDDK